MSNLVYESVISDDGDLQDLINIFLHNRNAALLLNKGAAVFFSNRPFDKLPLFKPTLCFEPNVH
jgi:hypothetical protein